ncbi:MAG: NAD(+)/NADH kinase, partial [Eubacteriales bacterium]
MLKIAITVNPNKDHNLIYTSQLLDILEQYDCRVFMSDTFKKPYGDQPSVSESLLAGRKIEYLPEYQLFRRVQLCIVFGGDGTILKIAKKAAYGGAYILGVNLGRVGYIAELETHELELVRKIVSVGDISQIESLQDVRIDRRMMLKAEIIRGGQTVYSATALNDIVISKGAVSRMAGLKLLCDGKSISTYRADGIVVSTPTGSTAYCMSAGGPIIDPSLECICAVPVCPYMCLNPGAVVFSDRSVIDVEFIADKINEAFCTIDGKGVKPIYNGDIVRITKSGFRTKLIRLKDRDFYGLLNYKFAIAQ